MSFPANVGLNANGVPKGFDPKNGSRLKADPVIHTVL